MAIAADFSVERATGNIRHTSGTNTYTVLELHRYLQALADDPAASGDDELDITDVTPSERSTDNIITLLNGYNIDDTAAQFLYDGSITQDDGDTIYAGLIVVGTVESGTQIQVVQNNTVYTSFWGTTPTAINSDSANSVITRFLVKVRTGGTDIDRRRLRVVARELGDTYDEFLLTCGDGNNTAALTTSVDLNNQTAAATIATWASDISNVEGFQQLDVDNDGFTEDYYSQWDSGVRSINDLYEYGKWLTRRGTASTIHSMNGFLFRGISHSFNYDGESSGPFVEDENLSWGTGATAGTGKILALDDNGTTGTIWIQRLTGALPTDNLTITGGTSTATALVNGTVTERTVPKQSFLGTYTGTALLGAYGIGLLVSDLTAADRLVDLSGTTRNPPNLVTFTVAGLTVGEDRVFVAPWDGSTLDDTGNPVPQTDQFALQTTLNGGSVTSVVVSTAIPDDTPTTGTIRVVNDEGYEVRLVYTAWAGSTFTVTSANFSGSGETDSATAGNDVYITYIDKLATGSTESFQSIFDGDRDLMVRVRDGGVSPIKTFVAPSSLTSGGGSITAIRTSDA
jgi:hypothetical protein